MSRGRMPQERQGALWLDASAVKTPPHAFYDRLNRALTKHGFDAQVEAVCEPYYARQDGRPSIPPGRYFRMVMIGYFEGIASERQIAWRCDDSLSLKAFLGLGALDPAPDHSSLSVIRKRLPVEAYREMQRIVLAILKAEGLLKGRQLAIDSTTVAANASMHTIVRRDTNESYAGYVKRLAKEAGEDVVTKADLARFDREREGRTTGNAEWKAAADADARVAKMKDGRVRMAYKSEHVVDAETGVIVAAKTHHADRADHTSAPTTLAEADANLVAVGMTTAGATLVADKGYHSNALLAGCVIAEIKTCVSEPKKNRRRIWTDKPEIEQIAYERNRRRIRGDYGKRLMKRRGESVERSFQHLCDRGGARRTCLRGLENNDKRKSVEVAAFNLGRLMRKLFGAGTPKGLAALWRGLFAAGATLRVRRRSWVRLRSATTPTESGGPVRRSRRRQQTSIAA